LTYNDSSADLIADSITNLIADSFSDRLLAWWRVHGRHDLPWQLQRTPYRVWVSEIMLQQTQVRTVIPYFHRFTERFPGLRSLADAELDDVLSLWTGLGYYARARNLHAAAKICATDYGGELPASPELLLALPGIGRSTANAIYAQAWNRRAPILDGNVKRALSRHAAIEGWPGRSVVEKSLWQEAEARTPDDHAADFTQAIMDLGAKLCTSRSPRCDQCPVSQDCQARIEGRIDEFPGKKPKANRPDRRARFLVLRNEADQVLLIQRPPSGIWGGLWCFPEQQENTGSSISATQITNARPTLPPIDHEFSHFRLSMQFLHQEARQSSLVEDENNARWFSVKQALTLGLPRPIQLVLARILNNP